MALLVETIRGEIATLNKNNIRLKAIGDLEKLPPRSYKALLEGIDKTKNNTRMTLILALNYSAKWEIMAAVKSIATKVEDKQLSLANIDEKAFENELSTSGIPDPELLIRILICVKPDF